MKKTISRTSAVLLAGAAMCALAAFGATNVITNDRSGPDVAAQVQVERAYGFRERLETVHEKGVRDRTLTVAADELVLADGTDIVIPPSSGEVLYGAARDFADYLFVSMDVSARVMRGTRDEGRWAESSFRLTKSWRRGSTRSRSRTVSRSARRTSGWRRRHFTILRI